MRKSPILMIVVGVCLALPVYAVPQQESLGDLARQLRAQREKESKKPVKVITNDDLPSQPPSIEGTTPASGTTQTPPEGEKTNPPATKPSTPASTGEKSSTEPESPEGKIKTKEYWQAKFAAARQELAQAKEHQQLAEDELNLLQIQAARELDPTAKQDLNNKAQAKQTEVDSARAATEKAQKALDDLQQEFKDSGAPEDWSQTS